jgi:MFS family permease
MWFTTWAVYFTQERAIAPGTVGLGMAVAAAAGLAAAVPVGVLADRRGPRGVLVAVTVVPGLLTAHARGALTGRRRPAAGWRLRR